MALRLNRASFLSTLKLYGSRGSICYSKEVLHGVIRSQWRLHISSSSEDDDFNELGPRVGENGRMHTKFITEKPDFFTAKQKFAVRKISAGMSSPAESIPTSNGFRISKLFVGSHGKLKNRNGLPASKVSTKKVTVRICNICLETAYCDIHSTCSAYGPLESLVIDADDSVDAIFSMKENSNVQELVNRFNKTTLDNSQWSAEVVPGDTNFKTNNKNLDEQVDKCSLRGQIATGFDDLRRKFTAMKINAADLEDLHLALVELESLPEANAIVPSFRRASNFF